MTPTGNLKVSPTLSAFSYSFPCSWWMCSMAVMYPWRWSTTVFHATSRVDSSPEVYAHKSSAIARYDTARETYGIGINIGHRAVRGPSSPRRSGRAGRHVAGICASARRKSHIFSAVVRLSKYRDRSSNQTVISVYIVVAQQSRVRSLGVRYREVKGNASQRRLARYLSLNPNNIKQTTSATIWSYGLPQAASNVPRVVCLGEQAAAVRKDGCQCENCVPETMRWPAAIQRDKDWAQGPVARAIPATIAPLVRKISIISMAYSHLGVYLRDGDAIIVAKKVTGRQACRIVPKSSR